MLLIQIFRRYGVVESRFCFEGGSRCGKGEGLYVLVTDQGNEITRTFRLAAEGKLSSKKRPASRSASGNKNYHYYLTITVTIMFQKYEERIYLVIFDSL